MSTLHLPSGYRASGVKAGIKPSGGLDLALLVADVPGAAAGEFTLLGGTPGKAANPGPAGADDVALVLHTSGTTARPKIVPLTHTNVTASAGNIARTLALGPEDACLNVMPLFHIHGLIAATLASLAGGGSVICTPGSLAQDVGLGLGGQAGERRLASVLHEAGFSSVRRATETPFNIIVEARP